MEVVASLVVYPTSADKDSRPLASRLSDVNLATDRTTLTGREFVMAAFDPLGADIGIGPQAARAGAMAAFGLVRLRARR